MLTRVSIVVILALACLVACNSMQTTLQSEPARTAAPDTKVEANPPAPDQITVKPVDVDLWHRIRQGLRLPDYEHARVSQELKWFASHQDYLDRVVERADPVLYMIVNEIERRNMPMEIALLPVIESGFRPFAYSHGSAAGIWQFIPGTGKKYGLKQNWWYDGRRDIPAATNAALDYLQALHKIFDGDWLHALAAYNSGEGRVRSAIRKNQSKGKPTDFWHLDLPRETRGYVPKLLAISSLVSAPEQHGIRLTTISNEQKLVIVETGSQIDLAMAANMAEISLEQLYQLNPAFNRWATDPDGPHHLLLPINKAQGFQDKLAGLPEKNRFQWKRHEIRNGESLGLIARHYGTTVSLLKKTNHIRGTSIRAGRHLIIPVSSQSLASYSLSSEQRKKTIQGNSTGAGEKIIHTVRKGDNLWAISQKYRISVRKLASWNAMAPRDTLKLGQKLVIWASGDKRPLTASGATIFPDLTSPQRTTKLNYVVRKGDSLSLISNKFRVTIEQLRKWNRLKSKFLQPGQRITVHVDITRQS